MLLELGKDIRYKCGSKGWIFYHINFRVQGMDPSADRGAGLQPINGYYNLCKYRFP